MEKVQQKYINILIKMTSYSKIDIKLTNQQISKLKDAIKNNKGAT